MNQLRYNIDDLGPSLHTILPRRTPYLCEMVNEAKRIIDNGKNPDIIACLNQLKKIPGYEYDSIIAITEIETITDQKLSYFNSLVGVKDVIITRLFAYLLSNEFKESHEDWKKLLTSLAGPFQT